MMKICFSILLFTFSIFPQTFRIDKIEPPNWWIGMEWDTLQLMVYGENLSDVEVSFEDESLEILKVLNVENPDYLFIDIVIPTNIKAGDYKLIFSNDTEKLGFDYPIIKRKNDHTEHQGFSSKDVIYLIMADRFADGNHLNNTIGDSLDEFIPSDLDGRKGGDIEGIISKLDYLVDLGVTALWITPMLENNMWMSYHGYAATDLYKIDPRFGTNELYKQLVEKAHAKGLKIILDHVSNHFGINHYWMKNLPMKDWINGEAGDHKSATHNKMALLDVHSTKEYAEDITKGWFTDYMVDLNQENEFVQNYLIQNTLWWLEFSGIDGIREDTYPYSDQKYLADWAEAVLTEYPALNILGEIWKGVPYFLAGYQSGSLVPREYDTNLPTVTDFAFSDAIRGFLSGENDLDKIYEVIAQDALYGDINNLVTFIDNHDISRSLFIADEDIKKQKIAVTMLLTLRGIPTLLYGTEVGIVGEDNHGTIRSPFIGGFENDKRSAFVEQGRSEKENDLFNFTQSLLKLRSEERSLQEGKLIHYIFGSSLYVYFRTLNDEVMLIVINGDNRQVTLGLEQFDSILKNCIQLQDITSSKTINYTIQQKLIIDGLSYNIYKVIY